MVTTAWSGAHDADLVGAADRRAARASTRRREAIARAARRGAAAENPDPQQDRSGADATRCWRWRKIANDTAKFDATFMISALTGDGVADLKAWLADAHAAGPVALSRGPDVGRAAAPARGRDHAREAVRAAAPGIALSVDGRDRAVEGTARTARSASSRRSMSSARASARS